MSRQSRRNEERARKLAFTTSILYLIGQVIELIHKLIE